MKKFTFVPGVYKRAHHFDGNRVARLILITENLGGGWYNHNFQAQPPD